MMPLLPLKASAREVVECDVATPEPLDRASRIPESSPVVTSRRDELRRLFAERDQVLDRVVEPTS
jgi:hypothetical protein